jgi:transcription initiation factor TFIID subunit 6
VFTPHTDKKGEKIFFISDPVLDFETVIKTQPLPRCPLTPNFTAHWLAIGGRQPNIPENPLLTRREDLEKERKAAEAKLNRGQSGQIKKSETEIKALVKHSLSSEEKRYFKTITEAVMGDDPDKRQAALEGLQRDAGLHQLVPYFTRYIADQVAMKIHNLGSLMSLMKMTRMMLTSRNIDIGHYLQQLMPPILSCMVARKLCQNPTEDHWRLRNYAASLIVLICQNYARAYTTLQPRIVRCLAARWLDPSKSLTTHYGAIVGLAGMGHHVFKSVLFPSLEPYLQLLREQLTCSNPTKRIEASNCYGALIKAAGSFVHREYTLYLQSRGAHVRGGEFSEAATLEHVFRLFGDGLLPYTQMSSSAGVSNDRHSFSLASVFL